ncbi:MAG: 6-pyruvoyl-tetrahydropterin synthase-related protein [Candidatus Daviesbacteria bacterium]|nr:6-pyruvoyl-tetrahydropterin synthase-related protein [Candidatus Daviesbacteria bacterium]
MKILEKVFRRERYILLLIFVLVLPALTALTQPGFFPTQDYIYVARIYQMNVALHDGQFPVRWAPDFRYGEPLFNFYAPLPYYVGSLVKDLGFSYLDTAKILYGLGFLLSGLAMYFLSREFFGKIGALLSAILYIYAPYHSVDVYVRGALSESWALIFFPLIFLASYKLSKRYSINNVIWLALSLAGLFFTHNIMTILFMPFVIGWWIYLTWQEKKWRGGIYFLGAFLLGVGLGASFLLPAFLEKGFVQSDRLITGYFNFVAHFVAIPEFFSTFWGYGASLWGPIDDMSFQVGLAHWAVLALSLILAFKRRKTRELTALTVFLSLEFLFSLFMQHNQSTPIWKLFPIMAFVQFPWRFLGISIFLASFLGGCILTYLPERRRNLLILPLVTVIILVYVGYFRPESYYPDSVDKHYIGSEVLIIDDKLPKDYLPIWVKKISPQIIQAPVAGFGKAQITNFNKRSDSATFEANVKFETEIETPITYFPGWEVKANNATVTLDSPDDLGLVRFKLLPGNYKIEMEFKDTQVRSIGNWLTLGSLLLLPVLMIGRRLIKK